MAYLLRHEPEGMDVDQEGFAFISSLLDRLRQRNLSVDRSDIRKVVETDPKGRYEIDGDRVRARYGHSITVEPTLQKINVSYLYHGTTPAAADRIQAEGLTSQSRQKVHLSKSVSEARKVANRRTSHPVIFRVDVSCVEGRGISIERASDVVYVADEVPPDCLELESTDERS